MDSTRRRVSPSWDWNGRERWWETTFTPHGMNGVGEVVGCERWYWNGSDSEVRSQYLAESKRTPEWIPVPASDDRAKGGPVADQERRYGFDELRWIAIGAAERARDLPNRTPEQCADAVLANLGIEKNPGPAKELRFESNIVFCRRCGRSPAAHIFGDCSLPGISGVTG